ncbi:hypothetical protein FXF51_00920 [Nonomuraea sp. PA05]|uniref:hypothetical protein n=1 Tax=Nonomuraea sp. PA05 TaxID=2604466 RepID=UPI0011D8DEA3|nr:hypothetical protein [Nonomuraea sp. PA05]TYB71034.1 hypothetical protein FXF51_00920 [Nonomuraea sp. PA05]
MPTVSSSALPRITGDLERPEAARAWRARSTGVAASRMQPRHDVPGGGRRGKQARRCGRIFFAALVSGERIADDPLGRPLIECCGSVSGPSSPGPSRVTAGEGP